MIVLQINAVTNINVKATSANPILANSVITFGFALDQLVLNVADIASLTFFQLDSSGNVGSQLTPTGRTSNSTHILIDITEWCSSGGTE